LIKNLLKNLLFKATPLISDMMKKEKLEKLASEKSSPCVTISMNTHRTAPDNLEDIIGLKNLLKEAHERVVNEFGKRPVAGLLRKN
jgi:hypothetical protein